MGARRFLAVRLGHERWPVVVAAVLTFGTGALDVLALVHLGGVFASVMTGNLALLGLGIARGDGSALIHAAVAVLGFVIGVAVGSRVTGVRQPDAPAWPPRVTVVLGCQLVLLCGLTVGWAATGADPEGGAQVALLATASGCMGLQSAAVRGLGAPVATTYLTGTLTSLVSDWTHTDGRVHAAGVASLVGAVAGAACSGGLLLTAPMATPALTLIPLAAIVAIVSCGRPLRRSRHLRPPRT